MIADLHIHTTASDGRLSPRQVIAAAAAAGLSAIAITDHDTIDGVKSISGDASLPVDLIPGIEFSSDLPYNEVHILGYGLDLEHPLLTQQLTMLREERLGRAAKMVEALHLLGYEINYRRVLELSGGAISVGRPHIAAALVEAGLMPDVATAFKILLGKGKPAYVPHRKLSPSEISQTIKAAGGLAVLAHPGQVGDDQIVREIISLGLDGLEVYHPSHGLAETERYLSLAKELGLLITGGSDFHGIPGRYPERLGEFTVPGELATLLLKSYNA